MKAILLALIVFGACTVGTPSTGPTGAPGGVDGGTQMGSNTGSASGNNPGSGSNAGSGSGSSSANACTGAVYDPCTDATQCTSGKCQLFSGQGIQVCTQTCTPGDNTTCPVQNGQPATCNNMGICKPPAANACTR
jgi:hypothetical protein